MTFTIVARDPDSGHLGVATASCSLAVGRSVPALVPGVGVVASQAYTNSALRGRVLEQLRAGATPHRVLAELGSVDPELALRQVLVVDAAGNAEVHTGEECSPWAGSLVGDGFVAAGNLLTGAPVVQAMADAFLVETGDHTVSGFAQRLLASLRSGDEEGGDRRGKQSAAILVADGGAVEASGHALDVDLRVDDHTDPVAELTRIARLRFDRLTARTG